MTEKKMAQKITAIRVAGTGNWENYMWPHQIDKNAETADEQKTRQPVTQQTINKNTVEKGATQFFNAFGSNITGGVNVHYNNK